MAVFVQTEGKFVLRVVFDGPALAGKSTNIRQLRERVSEARRGEIVTPEEVDGRTRYFDWMQLDGGVLHGYGLRCQMVTVPGQSTLTHRRVHALEWADAVVFVCESTPRGIERAQEIVRSLRGEVKDADPPIPIVVQANKQDVEGALPPEEVAARLGLEGAPLFGAVAERGEGVRETAIMALRLAAKRVERIVQERGAESIIGSPQSHAGLLMAMLDDFDTIMPPPNEE